MMATTTKVVEKQTQPTTTQNLTKFEIICVQFKDQIIKYSFLPLVTLTDYISLRQINKILENNFPKLEYKYFKAYRKGRGRFDSKFGTIEMKEENYKENDITSLDVSPQLDNNVICVITNWNAFSALKRNGSVCTWGCPNFGGDSSAITKHLEKDIIQIVSTYGAFAALNKNGFVFTWGREDRGGQMNEEFSQHLVNIIQICSTESAFAALDVNGNVISWGDRDFHIASFVPENEFQNVKKLISNDGAFAILKTNGTVQTWGYPFYGGELIPQIETEVIDIVRISHCCFCAVKENGKRIIWGGALSRNFMHHENNEVLLFA